MPRKAALEPPLSGCRRRAASRYARRISWGGASICTPSTSAASPRRSASVLTCVGAGPGGAASCLAMTRASASVAAASPTARFARCDSNRSRGVGGGNSPPMTLRRERQVTPSGPPWQRKAAAAAARRTAACAPCSSAWAPYAISQNMARSPSPCVSPASSTSALIAVSPPRCRRPSART